jgi:hypothetical protein
MRARRVADEVVLLVLLVPLMGVVLLGVRARDVWSLGAPPLAPFCTPGQTPHFEFGFADIAAQLGGLAGQPIECEHGDQWTPTTIQTTTTGVAVYDRCTNTPSFVRGPERWSLTQTGLEYWSGQAAPPPRPTVQPSDLRDPCGHP